MQYGFIKPSNIPSIGFAHHFYTDNTHYAHKYHNNQNIEFVYVNSGGIEAEFEGEKLFAPEGSVFVLFRSLPISLKAIGGTSHSHSTVQAQYSGKFYVSDSPNAAPANGALLPFVLMPCKECEIIKKEIYAIISELGKKDGQNSFAASLKIVNIIRILDEYTRSHAPQPENAESLISYKVKKYIRENIAKAISLKLLADHLGKSPNYINSVFKKENGITILQYINRKKMSKAAELMTKNQMSFKDSCKAVGVNNIQYAQKLFERHIGAPPVSFAEGSIHRNKQTQKNQ